MRKREFAARTSAVVVGTLLLTGLAGAAAAEEVGSDDVDVNVEIAEIEGPGVLAMSVGGTSTTLTETGSTELVRQFTGTLPTVTVTDTRAPEDIPADVGWYVLGSSTDFVGDAGQTPIGAEYLGWIPALINGGDSGLVTEGDPVDTAIEGGADGVGLVDQELLALAIDSGAVASEGQWTANANLFLRTPATVAPGSYTSTLTLSLFE
ncbi:hypothetical protein SAMN06295879_2993 [Agreia bicolorata]|uniref:WxL domain-containing protein n=1 Tax=Agreia bicolorata TaxID=110935 RepID=A0A1T4YF13_9MICO|nr:hypothetical protein [Agreia bicolorata]SKB00359.1 hypothetical protein SAMN06295879_2993 [Agreia bicolorata]